MADNPWLEWATSAATLLGEAVGLRDRSDSYGVVDVEAAGVEGLLSSTAMKVLEQKVKNPALLELDRKAGRHRNSASSGRLHPGLGNRRQRTGF